MKIAILLFLSLIAISKCDVDENALTDYFAGFIVGLHIEKLTESVGNCIFSIDDTRLAIMEVIHAYREGQNFYNFVNVVTEGMKTISPLCRNCVVVPEDVTKYYKALLEEFKESWEVFFHAALLNLAYKTQDVATDIVKLTTYISQGDHYKTGYYSGDIINAIFNVTQKQPIPLPPPIMLPQRNDDDYLVHTLPSQSLTQPNINWDDFHKDFRMYFNYSMIYLNYTKWINATTFRNLNSSVTNIELSLYNAFNAKDQREQVLTFIDITLYLNALFNGFYFTGLQLPKKITKNTVFQHPEYFGLNLLLHSGYFLYDGGKIAMDIKDKKYFDMVRRISIIVRKMFYLDDDILDEISRQRKRRLMLK